MDNDAEMSAEMSDGRWLDYDQLAQLRRIDKPSAVKLATRNNWRRRKANTGQMQVLVPIHWFERSQGKRDRYADKSVDMSADLSAFDAALQAVTEAKDSEIATLREAFEVTLTAKNGEIMGLREQWERAMAYLDAERSRADELRGRLDRLGGKLTDAQAELAAAQDQVEALTRAEPAAGEGRPGAVQGSVARRVTAGRRPMADFTVTMDVIKRISEIETPHGKALNEDITEAFPDNPDAAYTLAVGFSVATLLGSFSDPSERANVVDGVNVLVRRMGCALTPVT